MPCRKHTAYSLTRAAQIKFVVYSAHKLPSLTVRPNKYVFEMSGISVYSYISFAIFVFVSNSKNFIR